MKPRRILFVLVLSLLAGNVAAQQPVPANRLVGHWQIAVTIGPCAGGPTFSFVAFNAYHVGGTLTGTDRAPPASHGPGEGLWQYQGNGQYKTRFQFNNYLPDGSFDGVQDIRTNIILDAAGTDYSATVYAQALNPDGSLRVALCGTANGERVTIE